MKSNIILNRFILVIFLSLGIVASGFSQNKPILDQRKFTDRWINLRNIVSSTGDYSTCFEFYKNNVKMIKNIDYKDVFIYAPDAPNRGGVYHIEVEFGFLAVGDQIYVKDVCHNEISDPITIQDDFVYIEVPASASHASNNIGPNDASSPYSRAVTPVNVGKCEPVNINAHALMPFRFYVGNSNNNGSLIKSGTYKINGIPIKAEQFNVSNTNGGPVNVAFNSDGSISTSDGNDLFESIIPYTGSSITTFEYDFNGDINSWTDFLIGACDFKSVDKFGYTLGYWDYLGDIHLDRVLGDFTGSNFKIEFDTNEYRMYVNGQLVKTVPRVVTYSTSGGSLSNGGTLPYRTSVNYNPTQSGLQSVSALIDGVVFAGQKFYVAEDIVINESSSNPACNGSASGSITVNTTGGQAPLQYSKDGGTSYQGSNYFGSLTSGSYQIKVRDASGCETSKTVSIADNAALTVSTASKTNANCNGDTNGSITLNASGGAGFYQYGISGGAYQASNTIGNLAAGNYTFMVKDAAGCLKTYTETIGLNSSLSSSISNFNNVSCKSGNNGSISISSSGNNGTVYYSIDGTNFQTASTFTGLTAQNYTVKVKDNICSVTLNQNISEPDLLTISGNVSNNVSCYNGSNATINVLGGGGTQPYSFSNDGTVYVNSATFGNLPVGNYKYWIKDANGCISTSTIFTVSQPTLLTAAISAKTDINCNAGSDGAATILAGGGVSPYSYSIDGTNYQGSNVFSGLTAGTKNFTVKDANQCLMNTTATLLEPTAFVLSLVNQQNLVCNTDSSGNVNISATGGVSPYLFSKNAGVGQTSGYFGTLAAGNYNFTAKDAHNCPATLPSVTITQPSPISISLLKKLDVNCQAYAKGELDFTASGSNGGFNFQLNGSTTLQNNISLASSNGVFTDLYAGNYILTATDQKGCKKDYSASIVPKNTNINFDIQKTLPTACTSTDGLISVINVSGGRPNPNYQYRISSSPSFSTNNTFSNLSNGNYFITVADDLCSYNKNVDLKIPNSLTAGAIISPISCNSPNANVNISPISGGNGGYQLAMNSAFSNNTNFTNLSPNTYTVLIKDSPLSCQTAYSFEVKEQNRADLKTSLIQNISCYNGSDGVIQALGDNNVGPFLYSINNLNNLTSNPKFEGLPAATYNVYAQNAMGCRDSIRVTLTQPTQILWSVSTKSNLCFGDKTGEITITANGGTPPYLFSIQGQYVSSNEFKNLPAGNYTTQVKDSKSCEFSQNTALLQPTELQIKPVYQDTITCFGLSNGLIRIDASGGTPGYIYAINDSLNYGGVFAFDKLKAGNYTFFVKDANKCFKQAELKATEPTELMLSLVSKADPLCVGDKNGKILLSATGGNDGGYTYIMDNALSQIANPSFENLNQGDYTFKVLDRKACSDTVTKVTLKWPLALSANIVGTAPKCLGDANGAISLNISGGKQDYKVQFINNLANRSDSLLSSSGTFAYPNLGSGLYSFNVTDANACKLTLSKSLAVPLALQSNINLGGTLRTADSVVVCQGQIVSLDAQNPGMNIQWKLNGVAVDSLNNNQIFEASKPGKYSVVVTNPTGCMVSDTFNLKNNQFALKADFLIPTQAFVGDTVVCLDITKPVPDEVTWLVPTSNQIISISKSKIEFVPNISGEQSIGILAKVGTCTNMFQRKIKIFNRGDEESTDSAYNYSNNYIQKISISPNPNNGIFILNVLLSKPINLTLKIFRVETGENVYSNNVTPTIQSINSTNQYYFNINLFNGLYVLSVTSNNQTQTLRFAIIND